MTFTAYAPQRNPDALTRHVLYEKTKIPFDAEAELTALLSEELAREIDREILNDLLQLR
jgi:hypothetical protein